MSYFDFRQTRIAVRDEAAALCAQIVANNAGKNLPAIIKKHESRADDLRTEATALRSRGDHDAADAKDEAVRFVQRIIDCLRAWIARRTT